MLFFLFTFLWLLFLHHTLYVIYDPVKEDGYFFFLCAFLVLTLRAEQDLRSLGILLTIYDQCIS